MSNKSDYNKPRTNLVELLPDVYRSDTNRAVFENLFNRFLTKSETEKVAGYIGEGNPNAVVKRQIKEVDVHRQGYQLQPILYNKIGSVEWMASWYDLLNEAERLGVEIERLPEWLNLLKFNWIPPVDIDKIIHYQDYYWYDEENPNSRPQYITIRSRCSTTIALVNFQQELVDEFGALIPTSRALPVDETLPDFSIVSINDALSQVIVDGDITSELTSGQHFEIRGTLSNNGIHQVAGIITYDGFADRSTISVGGGTLTGSETGVGDVRLRRFDKLAINGEYIRLLDPGFVFFYKGSTNVELNSSFFSVVESEYDEALNETIIKINLVFTNDIVDGVISQEEKLASALAAKDCQCTGAVGWDLFQWDDNPEDPLWEGDHSTLIAGITNPTIPVAPGTEGQLWWAQDVDRLYQYSSIVGWKIIWSNFSLILNDTTGLVFWDLTPGCGVDSVITASDQWIDQNKWLHKSDVPNFSIAKQAAIPIIEYDWDLELNEWTYTSHAWKYREDNYADWNTVETTPELIELVPIDLWLQSGEEIVLAERYGDLTDYFTPGRIFMGTGVSELFEVEYSQYVAPASGQPQRTQIKLTVPVTGSGLVQSPGFPTPSPTPLRPVRTSEGDSWKGYNVHWVYGGQIDTVPVVHQPENHLMEIALGTVPILDTSGDYEYTFTHYVQSSTVLIDKNLPSFLGLTEIVLTDALPPGSDISLRRRALMGSDDTRVYVNDIRQYGTFEELNEVDLGIGTNLTHVVGVRFLTGFELSIFDVVRIEVGEASPQDFGLFSVSVRTIEDNTIYGTSGNETVSLIRYRKEEQVKSELNQYPLFDIYKVDGTPAYKANQIFGFLTSPDADVNGAVGLRVVTDTDETDYQFQQFLVDSDGVMYAYRDYANQTDDLWVTPETEQVFFWDGFSWSNKKSIGNHYTKATVSPVAPDTPWADIEGMYWYDTLARQLKIRVLTGSPAPRWDVVTPIYSQDDFTLQTIWRKGLNNETYVPQKRDWETRTLEEYTAQKDVFVEERAEEIVNANPSLSVSLATSQAEDEWGESQSNHLSLNGDWVGDWEIPDPMYFNAAHENRQVLSFRELLTHFDSIIQAQPKIPAFNGPFESMFHLIPTNEVNYGLGGKIKEFNYGFDTFLSSLFVNAVNPRSLFEFAHDQHESLLNNLKELYRRSALDLFLDVSTDSLVNVIEFATQTVIDAHEQNDNLALLYGDSTTFTEVEGSGDIGLRNWIATLPYLNLLRRRIPFDVADPNLEINQIVHHDGHRGDYFLAAPVIEGIVRSVIDAPDDRTRFPGPADPAVDTYGRISTTLPPNDDVEFGAQFNTTIINREGVYWYHVVGPDRIFYRLSVAAIGTEEPSVSLPNGTLWLDYTPAQEVLRVKETNPNTGAAEWNIVDGLTPGASPIRLHNGTDPSDVTTASVSAWQVVDLNEILREIVGTIENRLYDNAPDPFELKYDFEQLVTTYPQLYPQLLEEAFLEHVNENEITAPFANDDYTAADPFTWNYRHSSPGQSYEILEAAEGPDSFKVEGDLTAGFGLDVAFYVKNSGGNDGFWRTHSSIPTSFDGTFSTIFTEGREVIDGVLGVIYTGILPSPYDPVTRPQNLNTGSESGGDWRDLYQKIYRTPYPHLEPWSLQGYIDKPLWWDNEYLNDDPAKWGDRRWKYKHGFDIVGVDVVDDWFEIYGDFRDPFTTGQQFTIDESPSVHDGVWQVGIIETISSVAAGPAGTATIDLPNDHVPTFVPGITFAVTSVAGELKHLLTVDSAIFTGPPSNLTIITVREEIISTTDYDVISGTTYDPVMNRSRILIDTGAVGPMTDITVAFVEGRIAKHYGMWENIRIGVIPPGQVYPNGIIGVTGNPSTDIALHSLPVVNLPTFNYFSVNIDNNVITTGGTFNSDDLFPPYWDYTTHFGTSIPPVFDRQIRSVYTLFNEITSPGANYVFGDAGPIEWEWRNASQFLYDQLSIAFQLDPVKFIFNSFGPEFHTVGGLFVNSRTKQVLSHTNTLFHGDIIDDQQIQFSGTNQWYVNFTRYAGLDISMSDFRSQWTLWTLPLMYQFSSFIDTPSLNVAHRAVCVSDFDYRVASKRSPGVEDFWVDSFDVVTLNIPPKVARYDNDYEWEFELQTKSLTGKSITHYDVHNYQFYADPSTDVCSLYAWPVVNVNIFNDTFSVTGDQTNIFTTARPLEITGSTGNDGTYTVFSSTYDSIANETIISVGENVSDLTKDGLLTLIYRTLPWQTGDRVVLSTRETLPVPLQGDDANGTFTYFVIVVDAYHFQLALTKNDAQAGNYIDITSMGRGDHFVGQLATTFGTDRTTVNWRHYAVDTSNVLMFIPPYGVRGLQTIINIIDGYEHYSKEQGWGFNSDNSIYDFGNSGRFVNWQLELERVIDFNINLRATRQKIGNKFEATIDITTDIWTFVDTASAQFITGDPIAVLVSGNVFPTPLVRGHRYYMIRDSLSEFRLAATKADAEAGVAIDITSLAGVGDVYITEGSNLRKDRPTFEINPFRNGIWFRPERGIVSNVIAGPVEDAFNTQLLLDQYGRALGRDKVRIFREDKETSIRISEQIPNDVELTSVFNDPYNFIHLAAAHLFIDTYEHVLIFNNETTEGNLLYDPFIGLNVTKFETSFQRQTEFTQRPNVGGQYLETFFNQGADLKRNFEASVEDLRLAYDTYQTLESNLLTQFSRKALGYEGERDYLNNLNLSSKSQFAFWRGQIQYKGSLNSIEAFVRSRRFIDAKVDEFWAVKVADFGSHKEKEYVEMWLSTDDARSNDLRLRLVIPDEILECIEEVIAGGDEEEIIECGFGAFEFGAIEFGCPTVGSGDCGFGGFEFGILPFGCPTYSGGSTTGCTFGAFGFGEEPYACTAIGVGESESCGFEFGTFDERPFDDDTCPTNGDGITTAPTVINCFLEGTEVLDNDRWFDQPEQLELLRNNGGILYFELKPTSMIPITISHEDSYLGIDSGPPLPPVYVDGTTVEDNDGWIEFDDFDDTGTFYKWNRDAHVDLVVVNDVAPAASPFIEVEGGPHVDLYIGQIIKLYNSTENDGIYQIVDIQPPTGSPPSTVIEVDMDLLNNIRDGMVRAYGKWEEHGKWGPSGAPTIIPTLRHNTMSDFITVTIDWWPQGHRQIFDFTSAGATTTITTDSFIPGSDGIRIFKDGVQLDLDTDYTEVDTSDFTLPGQVQFTDDVAGSIIIVVFKTSTLKDGIHFSRLNSNIIQFNNPELISTINGSPLEPQAQNLKLWSWIVDKESQNPGKIVDKTSEVVLTPVQIWDPARGFHYYNGIHVVELQNAEDPAIYTNTPRISQLPDPNFDFNLIYPDPWNETEVGTTWLDKTNLDYLPYYDEHVMVDIEDRSRLWGTLADWGDVKIYTWVQSDVPPSEWDALAAQEEGNTSIPDDQRKSGQAKQSLFEQDPSGNWAVLKDKVDQYDNFIEGEGDFSHTFTLLNITDHTRSVNVYVNGQLVQENVLPSGGQVTVTGLRRVDRIRIVQHIPTDEDFIEAQIEAGNMLRDYEYTEDIAFDELGLARTVYYFWVEDKSTRGDRILSPNEAQNTMKQIPIPYMFFEEPKDVSETTFSGEIVHLPIRFNQVIIRGLRGFIDDDFRYVFRWTRDFTLRDTLETGETPLQNKNLHEQWELIRREQQSHIPRWLWNKVTESIVGYKLDNPAERVPSYERELYDTSNGTDTQYGLSSGQTFTSGTLALATILADLNNPDNDFAPVDINVFFQNHSFDTAENIITAMDTMYNTFENIHVNRIFFDTLLDGLSLKGKYADIFKTSMVALHGIRPFQVAGLFDD